MNNKLSTGFTRRKALKMGIGAIVATTLPHTGFSAAATEITASSAIAWDNPYRHIRGFNYQPGYGATGYAIWSRYHPEKFDREPGLSKKVFYSYKDYSTLQYILYPKTFFLKYTSPYIKSQK